MELKRNGNQSNKHVRYVRLVGCNRREFKFMFKFRNVGRAAFHESVSEIRERKEKEEYNTVGLLIGLMGFLWMFCWYGCP